VETYTYSAMQNKQESGKRTVTIVEVAEKAGVSVATASRALSGRGYASAAVKERVRTAAQQLNYRLNASARSLKIQRTNNIGLVITDITNPFYSYLASGVLTCAQEMGYHVILCATNEDPEMEREYMHVLLEQRVDGIIAVPSSSQPLIWQEVVEMRIPLVLVDRAVSEIAQADTMLVNNVKGSYLATQYLIQLGHERIGLISGPSNTTTGYGRTKGYIDALNEAGIPVDQQLIQGNSFIRANGYHATQTLLSLPEIPTAIFATNNVLGEAAIFAIRERGLSIPNDISFVMFDDVPWAALIQPAVTVINQPTHHLGYMSLKILEKRLQESETYDERTPVHIVMEPELIERESCLARTGSFQYRPSPSGDEPVSYTSDSSFNQGEGK
jgi:LacI family transcriptional regulator